MENKEEFEEKSIFGQDQEESSTYGKWTIEV